MPILEPGDHLLYSGSGFWSWTIKVKTWSKYSHVELYIGNSKTFTSRDGEGVNFYDFTDKNLAAVYRPNIPFDISKGMEWMKSVCGQKYDFWGLMRFFTLGKQSQDKQFCSEAVVRADRQCLIEAFNQVYDADLVSPGMFASSPHLDLVWEKEKTK